MMDVRRGAGGIGAGPVWHKAGWKKRFVKSTDFERDGSGVSQRDRYERENGHGMKEEKRIIRGKRSLPFSCRPRKLTPSFECVHVSKRVPQSQSDWCVLSCIELTLLHPSIHRVFRDSWWWCTCTRGGPPSHCIHHEQPSRAPLSPFVYHPVSLLHPSSDVRVSVVFWLRCPRRRDVSRLMSRDQGAHLNTDIRTHRREMEIRHRRFHRHTGIHHT